MNKLPQACDFDRAEKAEPRRPRSRTSGLQLGHPWANGDKVHFSYQVTAPLKEGVPQNSEAAWNIVGGTEKFTGIKGKGTCKGKTNPDGSRTWDCAGQYQIAKQ